MSNYSLAMVVLMVGVILNDILWSDLAMVVFQIYFFYKVIYAKKRDN